MSAGERATVALPVSPTAPVEAPAVAPVTLEEIRRELAWQAPRLQFDETPLAEAIAEFNRLNRQQLVLGEPKLGGLLMGGTFRPDNVEGFVRLLAATHGLAAEPDAQGASGCTAPAEPTRQAWHGRRLGGRSGLTPRRLKRKAVCGCRGGNPLHRMPVVLLGPGCFRAGGGDRGRPARPDTESWRRFHGQQPSA